MNRAVVKLVAGLLAGLTPMAVSAASDGAPERMPGLWLMNTGQVGTGKASSFHVCVNRSHDDLMAQPEGAVRICPQGTWLREGSQRVRYQARCRIGEVAVEVIGTYTGDFQYNYQGDLTVRYEPPLEGVSTLALKMDGRRLAPCKAKHTPGMLLVPGAPDVGNPNLGD